MLEIKSLVAAYGEITALHGLDLSIKKDSIVAILGGNGAGKTTLLKCISGLLKPKSGEITFAEKSLVGKEPEKIVALGLSHVPEGRLIFPSLTVRENLIMGAVEVLLISESVKKTRVIATCRNCSKLVEKSLDPDKVDNYISTLQKIQCSECNNVNWDIELRDLIMDLGDLAEKSSTQVEIISSQTEEGRQIESFGGICVILRYVLT